MLPEPDELKAAAELVRAGLPLLDKVAGVIKRALPSKTTSKGNLAASTDAIQPSTALAKIDEGALRIQPQQAQELLDLVEDLRRLPALQRRLAGAIRTLFTFYDIASKLRTECDKTYELAINVQPAKLSEFFWETQLQMMAKWDERDATLIKAIQDKRMPVTGPETLAKLTAAADRFRNAHTKILNCLDDSEKNLNQYRIFLRNAKSAALEIEGELKQQVEDLVSDVGYGEAQP